MIAVLSIAGLSDQKTVSSAILAILGLVSTGLIVNRHENKRLKISIDRLSQTDSLEDSCLNSEFDSGVLSTYARKSKRIDFWGVTLETTVTVLRKDIERGSITEANLEVRALLLKPSSPGVAMAAFRSSHSDLDDMNRSLENAIKTLTRLAEKYPKMKIELRCMNYLPPYTVSYFDPHLETGYIFARCVPFRPQDHIRPNFVVTNNERDTVWFNFFKQQFEAAWDAAEPITQYPNT